MGPVGELDVTGEDPGGDRPGAGPLPVRRRATGAVGDAAGGTAGGDGPGVGDDVVLLERVLGRLRGLH